MTPTHILVPIEYDENGEMSFQHPLKVGHLVDLSEEGIKAKAATYSFQYNNGFERDAAETGYQQCAKDLLNTNP